MATSLRKTDQLVKQCEQLSETVTKFNKTIEDTIATTTNDMNYVLTAIGENIHETMNTVVNDLNEWEELKKNLSKTQLRGRVLLDVGGRHFTTTVETLTTEKDTFFTALFSRNWEVEKDKDGRIFIDRDGDLFAEILGFLRSSNEFIMPDERLRKRLIQEARFYKLKSLLCILTEPERKKEEEKRQLEQAFMDDTLLTTQQKKKLNEFYGNLNQHWQLIYKATRDGFAAATFHQFCDNQGPTMVIVRSSGGYLFGGYASQSWNSSGMVRNAPNSFLFLLTNANGSPPTKFACNNNVRALLDCGEFGPTFGAHDLYICSGSNISKDSCCNMMGNQGYPNSLGLGPLTFTGGHNFTTTEIEVFKLLQ